MKDREPKIERTRYLRKINVVYYWQIHNWWKLNVEQSCLNSLQPFLIFQVWANHKGGNANVVFLRKKNLEWKWLIRNIQSIQTSSFQLFRKIEWSHVFIRAIIKIFIPFLTTRGQCYKSFLSVIYEFL